MALAAALLSSSCLSAFYRRETRFEPVPEETLAALNPGTSDLGECLERLGAPLWVWEYEGSGVALAYGWLANRGWNLHASYSFERNVSASFTWQRIDARMKGVVLFFDEDWKLVAWRSGLLRDLTAGFRERRPAAVLDEGEEKQL